MSAWQRFLKFIKPAKQGGCMEWGGAISGNGYGNFWYGGRAVSAHRVSYILHHGEVGQGMVVCHACDNPLCVNPSHLFLGSQKENIHDCIFKGRFKPRGVPQEGHRGWEESSQRNTH